ncbi:MAG: ABC transporter substrate-binding protein [Planctomycetes bacterium]|nr:ABC transporter substrate-binding protein [Planctomycetota bacterium]
MRLLPILVVVLLGSAPVCQQQPPASPTSPAPRIGVFFWHDSPNDLAAFAGIKAGLERAHIGGEFLERHAGSDPARATAALRTLRAAGCDLVFAMGTQSALLAKDALPDVPIVFAAVSNPVASGVVPSWDGSGSRLCGASNWIAPRNVLDVFCIAVPDLKHLGILRSADAGVVSKAELQTMQAWLRQDASHGVELFEAVAADAADIPRALSTLLDRNIDALWIPIDITVYGNLELVQRTLGERRLPLLSTAAAAVRQGAVVGAIADYELHGRRAAAMAVAILRDGAVPGRLPVDRMQGSLVVANLGTARALGLELPLSLLVLADQLIESEARYGGR